MINMALIFDLTLSSFIWIWINFGLIFIIHFLIPKNILKTYFIEPYFKSSEIMSFSGFPFAYIRTLMFMRILGFPESGRKRGLEKVYETAPIWLCNLSKYVVIYFLASFSLFILLIAISGFHMLLS